MKTISELKLKDIYESMVNRYFAEKANLQKTLGAKQQELRELRYNRDRQLKQLESSKNTKEAAMIEMTEKTSELIAELSSLSDSIVKSMLITELNNIKSEKEQKLFDVCVAIRDFDSRIVEVEHEISVIIRRISILDGQYPIFIGLTSKEAMEKYETFVQI